MFGKYFAGLCNKSQQNISRSAYLPHDYNSFSTLVSTNFVKDKRKIMSNNRNTIKNTLNLYLKQKNYPVSIECS